MAEESTCWDFSALPREPELSININTSAPGEGGESDDFRTNLVKSEHGNPCAVHGVLISLQLPENLQPRLVLDGCALSAPVT